MRALLPTVVVVLVTTATASANDTPPSTTNVDVMGNVGAASGDGFGGVVLGGTAIVRSSWLAAGGTLEASGLFASRFGAGALGGVSYRHDNGFGFDLLAALGVHHYQGVGRGILSDNPGVDATLPFAGARSRLSYRLGRRFQFGGTALLDSDLSRVSKTTSYTSTSWWDGSTSHETSTERVGFTTVGLTLDVGASF